MIQKPKRLLIVIITTAVIVGLLGIYFVTRSVTNPSEQFTELPVGATSSVTGVPVVPGVKRLVISTPQGDILLNDPRTRAGTVDMGSDLYALTSLENVADTPFSIIFSATDGTFAVGLEQEPIGPTRQAAETYLQSALGIDETALCSLNIYVGTTDKVNQFYSGRNLGLSFCPNSVEL